MTDIPPYPGTPLWAKLSGVVAVALVVLLIVMLMTGDRHGPGRHMQSGDHSAGDHQ